MDVRWLGHATVLIELDGIRLLTDPLLRSHVAGFIRRRVAPVDPRLLQGLDAVLISHLHQDHLDLESLRTLAEGTRLVVPRGAGRWLSRRGFEHVTELAVGERLSIGRVTIEATHAEHGEWRVPLGPRAEPLGYLVQGTAALYFAGDTGLFEQMSALPARLDLPLDLALLPVWGWGPTLRGGHLDPASAAEALRRLGARRAIPIHWGTYWPLGMRHVRSRRFRLPGHDFAAASAHLAPASEVLVLHPGQSIAS